MKGSLIKLIGITFKYLCNYSGHSDVNIMDKLKEFLALETQNAVLRQLSETPGRVISLLSRNFIDLL